MKFQRIGVVGSGIMGSGIAQVAAYHGSDVLMVDIDRERVDAALAGIQRRLQREAERGRISTEDAEAATGRLSGATDSEGLDSMRDMDAVIEAVAENLDAKSRSSGRSASPKASWPATPARSRSATSPRRAAGPSASSVCTSSTRPGR